MNLVCQITPQILQLREISFEPGRIDLSYNYVIVKVQKQFSHLNVPNSTDLNTL